MTIAEMETEVLRKVSIPDYIYEIVVPNMQEYYDGDYPVDFEVSRYIKCCFHSEDSPSLRWYEETNTFYCFGCGKGGRGPMGTVIGFHMYFTEKMTGRMASRNDAIVFLYNYFVNGKDTRNVLVDTRVEKKGNSETELAGYNLYKNDIDKAVQSDQTIPMEKKVDIYDRIDRIDMMLFKDIIRVNEARQALDSAIAKL